MGPICVLCRLRQILKAWKNISSMPIWKVCLPDRLVGGLRSFDRLLFRCFVIFSLFGLFVCLGSIGMVRPFSMNSSNVRGRAKTMYFP